VPQSEKSAPSDLRVSSRGNIVAYVTRAVGLFDGTEGDKFETITMRGIDRAIPMVLTLAEVTRRRVAGLH
jgi:hypothetical protein